MKTRITRAALLLGIAILLTLGLGTAALAAPWSDLPSTTLGKYKITETDVAGISQGFEDGTWKPDQLVTRAQFTKMAMEAFGIAQANPATASFADVPADHQYYQWIEGAKAAGLVNGVTTTEFAPDATMTHEQCFAIVMRWVAKATGTNMAQAYPVEVWAPALARYPDGGAVSASLKDEVAMAVKYGVYQAGDWGKTLAPQYSVKRIEAAAAIVRGMMVDGDRIGILGVAGGPPFANTTDHIGFLLIVNGDQYMIDCGDGSPNNIYKLGLAYKNLKNVFFTHLHIDHTAGYSDLLARASWTNPNPLVSLAVWGPPGVAALDAGATEYLAYPRSQHNQGWVTPTVHEFTLPDSGIEKVMEDDNVVVTATKVYHDGPRPTYAYRFDIKATGKSVVFSGDTGPGPEGSNSGEQLIALAQDADVLVHEAQDNDSNYLILDRIPDPVQREQIRQALEYGHTDVKLLPSIAKQANVGAVVFHHYVPSFIPVDVFYNKAVGAAAAVGYTGRIIAPVDLDVIGF